MESSKKSEIIQFLKKLEFGDIESQIYIKLLEMGRLNITDLSKYLNIPRTSVHRHTQKLLKKRFIVQSLRGKYKEIIPESPQKLKRILDNKEMNLKSQLEKINALQTLFPQITKMMRTSIPRTKEKIRIGVKYYEGNHGAKTIYQRAFEANELRSYVNLGETHKVFPGNDELFRKIQKKHTSNLIREIIDSSKDSYEKALRYSSEYNFEFKRSNIPLGLDSINILIFDNRVAMINFKQPIIGSVLTNQDYYLNSIALFDHLWKSLE